MSAQVIFTATQGALDGRQFIFTGKTLCIVGRSQSCEVCVPADDYAVSRRHCLLDIDAPAVTLQDLGSLNGTYLNGELIGQRDKKCDAEDAAQGTLPRFTLQDGDEFRVGDTAFRVRIVHGPLNDEVKELTTRGENYSVCI
jgi:pSer/pThr/pTyr-binding forkhead associated (FHA) protein